MSVPSSFVVDADAQGQRLDRFLGDRVEHVSREKVKKAIQQGHCRVQGLVVLTPGTRLTPGQKVELHVPAPSRTVQPEDGAIAPLWHDTHVLVLDKPAGITVHPCPSCPEGTLVQRLAAHFPQLMEQEGLRPGIVHRLDKDTSGLLLVALSEEARLQLSADFAARRVGKEYLALVRGVPPAEGESREPLGRHPLAKVKMAVVPENRGGRPAHSTWRVLYADPGQRFSLISVTIHTGRTHQIRVHMAHAGFPLWGDALYGPPPGRPHGPRQDKSGTAPRPAPKNAAPQADLDPAPRQMLHAWKLTLAHPVSGEPLSFTCPPPPDILATALALSRRMQRIVVTGLPGCGKSTLLHCWQDAGLPVWSADEVVARLYAPGGHGHDFLRTRFGDRFVPAPKAAVDRKALRLAMDEDAFLRQEVESAVHTLVRQDLEQFWLAAAAAGQELAAAEIPLYLETGWDGAEEPLCEQPWLVGVSCAAPLRHRRLAQHRGWSEERCAQMDRWQWPEERKMRACRQVLHNDGDQAALACAALEALQTVRRHREERAARLADELGHIWQA